MKKKVRLDVFLSEKGLSQSTGMAGREIISGWVKVNGETVREPSKNILGDEVIKVERPKGYFASRGGEKLNYALKEFNIHLEGKVAADLGASTGGFTDCMLKAGALRVYAIDVGYGQLDYSLRIDNRVTVKERTNVKDLTHDVFDTRVDFVTADLSFISIISIFDKIKDLFSPVEGIILIKPQFEAGPDEHKKGVVREKENHKDILTRVIDLLIDKGMILKGLCYSPIKGPAGNIEFLLYFMTETDNKKSGAWINNFILQIDKVVDEAHDKLNIEFLNN